MHYYRLLCTFSYKVQRNDLESQFPRCMCTVYAVLMSPNNENLMIQSTCRFLKERQEETVNTFPSGLWNYWTSLRVLGEKSTIEIEATGMRNLRVNSSHCNSHKCVWFVKWTRQSCILLTRYLIDSTDRRLLTHVDSNWYLSCPRWDIYLQRLHYLSWCIL